MKLTRYMMASLVLSLIFHLLLMLFFSDIGFVPPLAVVSVPPTEAVVVNLFQPPVDMTKIQKPEKKEKGKKEGSGGNGFKKSISDALSESSIKEIFERELLTPKPVKPTVRFAGIEKTKLKPILPTPPAVRKATAPRPEILEIDVSKINPVRIQSRKLTPKVERVDVPDLKLPSLLPHGSVVSSVGPTYDVGIRFTPPKFGGPAVIGPDEDDTQPGTGLAAGNPDLNGPPDLSANMKISSVDKSGMPGAPVPFDRFVDISMLVKDDPTTGGGFYAISIKANEESDSIREIPKDILIILDRSTSISPKKFTAFKKAAMNALEYLNPTDNFNIVTFADKPLAFSPEYKSASDENRELAREFINTLTKGGTTNVFNGLYPFVKNSKSDNGRPLNIFFLTDGISTVNIYADDDFLRQISGINPGHVSIFPFSAGKDANRDLLDFLGYLNRGSSRHAPELVDIPSSLSGFIADHCSLLVRDIEYMASGNLGREIYPKKIKHLYRSGKVELFGRFGPADTAILLTVVGYDASGKKRDLIFKCNFADCERTRMEIDKQWCANKILHLLADRTLTFGIPSKNLKDAEIKRLASQFNLAVPY